MTLTEEQFNNIAEEVMTDLPFVDWDRAAEWIYEGRKCMRVFGWIEREKDEYKDFVIIGIYEIEDVEEANIEFIGTSSESYTEEIFKRLFPDADLDEHNECFRLENRFDVENVIELDDRGENQ